MAVNKMGPTHLVIPDTHAKANQDFRRFDWLGEIICDLKPDTIIHLGDHADMESLCTYDKGTKGFEGRRYRKDIESAQEAMDRLFKPINSYNAMRARNKTKQYKPRKVMLLGNHENRIDRAINADSILDGTISVDDLRYKKYGWEVHPFLDEVEIDGVTYSHYFVSGVMARPIGGEHPAATLLRKQFKSCTAGHSHLADFAQRRAGGGQHIMGCVAGCYFEHEEEYVPSVVNKMWWRGIVIKRNVVNGCYDPQFMSLNTIKRTFNIPEGG